MQIKISKNQMVDMIKKQSKLLKENQENLDDIEIVVLATIQVNEMIKEFSNNKKDIGIVWRNK